MDTIILLLLHHFLEGINRVVVLLYVQDVRMQLHQPQPVAVVARGLENPLALLLAKLLQTINFFLVRSIRG